jgi:hypothetical protein
MPEVQPDPCGLLLITVWRHDGQLVARLRATDRLDQPAYDIAVEVGPSAIGAAVEEWLLRHGRDVAGTDGKTQR